MKLDKVLKKEAEEACEYWLKLTGRKMSFETWCIMLLNDATHNLLKQKRLEASVVEEKRRESTLQSN